MPTVLRTLVAGLLVLVGHVGAFAQPDGGGEVSLEVRASRDLVRPGDQIAIAVVFDHAPSWHVQANEEAIAAANSGVSQLATRIAVEALPGVSIGPVQWPEPHLMSAAALGDPSARVPVFEGRAIAYIPVIIGDKAPPGDLVVRVEVSYQVCDDTQCMLPVDDVRPVALKVLSPGERPPAGGTDAGTFAGFDNSIFSKMLAGTVKPAGATLKFTFFGWPFTISTSGAVGLLLLLSLAALGGFLLNLTPCVLPVIPIKILSLSQAAGNPARCFLLGLVMSVGVIAFWVGIGAAIAFVSGFTAINQLFQMPWFSLGVGVFIAVMGLGMLGLFTVSLPQAVYMLDPKRESVPGSFVFGIMTAVLSTPCTAPFMGTAAAWAAKQAPTVTLSTFGAIGAGMALPYLVLSAFPALLSRVPRTGPASELVKQVMGLLMFAVAVFFIGTGLDPLLRAPIDPPIRVHWWIVAGLIVLSMGWLVVRTFRISGRALPRLAWSVAGVLLSAAAVFTARHFTDHGPINWVAYTPERFAERVAKGDVIVMDFTAEWCLNCKAIEAAVLHQEQVVGLLHSPGVTPMKVDLTGNNVAGQEKLKSLDWVGIPLLAVFGPGLDEPLKYDTYTPETVRLAVEQARGGSRTASRTGVP